MKYLQNTFLFRAFKQNKFIFCFILTFIFFQQYFYSKKNSSFPWYVWIMYSYPNYEPDTLTQLEIYIDNKRLNLAKIPIWQEAVLVNTFKKYYELQQTNYHESFKQLVDERSNELKIVSKNYIENTICNQKEEAEKYKNWILAYMEKYVVQKKIHQIEYKEVHYKQTQKQFTKAGNSKLLLTIKHAN